MSKRSGFSDKARNILGRTDGAHKPKSMREFLEDAPDSDGQGSAAASAHLHTGANVRQEDGDGPADDPTDRLHCFIPRSLKLRVEAYVLERKRDRQKGEKIDITSVVIEALTEKLDREGH